MTKYEKLLVDGELSSKIQAERLRVAAYQASIPFEIDISKVQKHIGKDELAIRTKQVWEFLKPRV